MEGMRKCTKHNEQINTVYVYNLINHHKQITNPHSVMINAQNVIASSHSVTLKSLHAILNPNQVTSYSYKGITNHIT